MLPAFVMLLSFCCVTPLYELECYSAQTFSKKIISKIARTVKKSLIDKPPASSPL